MIKFLMTSLQHTPFPRGPYVTGCVDIMHGRTKEGTLMRLFYPCQEDTYMDKPDKWTKWFPGEAYLEGVARFSVPQFSTFVSYLLNWQTSSCLIPSLWEAPIAKGSFPVIVFSHGLAGNRNFYSTICSDIVSHGFIVASVEHRDESAAASFTLSPSGEKEFLPFKTIVLDSTAFPIRKDQVRIRAKECIRALNLLEKLNFEEVRNELSSNFDLSSLRNKLDLSFLGMVGHSFGAATSLLTLSMDKRFKYGVGFDPWMYPLKDDVASMTTSIQQPCLCIMTELFARDKKNMKALQSLEKDNFRTFIMKGTSHQNQSDTPFVLGIFGQFSVRGSTMDSETAMIFNNKLAIGFINKTLGLPNRTSKLGSSFLRNNLMYAFSPEEVSLSEVEKFIGVKIVDDDSPEEASSNPEKAKL